MNFTIDPRIRFIIGIFVTFAIGVTQGTISLTNAIPDVWIKPTVAWCGILAFVGSFVNTAISGIGMSTQSRLAAAAAIPEVKTIEVAVPEVAQAAPSPKVVAKP